MSLMTVFWSTFALIFIGELGDKTQIAAGTGTLANRRYISVIFLSSSLALIVVAGLTVFFAGLIPDDLLPIISKIGGGLLIAYGIYLFFSASNSADETEDDFIKKNHYGLFVAHFTVVFMAELGDKTQIATLAVAVENPTNLLIVFLASASALVMVTAITVWGVTKVKPSWVKKLQQAGAAMMVAYGAYMLY